MYERRAADALWLELRAALLGTAREQNSAGSRRILIDDARPSTVRLQHGQRCLAVEASREVVMCTVKSESDPDGRMEVPVELHPGTVPSFRLEGRTEFAEAVARKLLNSLLQHES